MPLTFHPRPGAVLMCQYEPGFVKPEMVKRRPVIVIAPRLRHRDKLCTVVPLSGERPNHAPYPFGPSWQRARSLVASLSADTGSNPASTSFAPQSRQAA